MCATSGGLPRAVCFRLTVIGLGIQCLACAHAHTHECVYLRDKKERARGISRFFRCSRVRERERERDNIERFTPSGSGGLLNIFFFICLRITGGVCVGMCKQYVVKVVLSLGLEKV